MKYDCSKTLDYLKERKRMCDMYDFCQGCPYGTLGAGCAPFRDTSQEYIDILQKWSDEHPEIPKLARGEYAFLQAFKVTADKHIERKIGHLWFVMGYTNMELWSSLFPFIKEGETWFLGDLLKLEVDVSDTDVGKMEEEE
jgi:hypothetical protein